MERPIEPGDLDEFQLVRSLGRGGMGEVYLGHDTVLDRAVAIKLIGSRSPDATSRERFLTEARAIARLSHPNVVTIFRVGTTADGRPFLVQELIRGRSLDHAPRPMPWRMVCELAIGVARGLDAAHRRGILHRDVKPANVMLDERGTARLLDFGLAKLEHAAPPVVPVARPPAADGVAVTRDAPSRKVSATDDLTPIAPVQRSPIEAIVRTQPGSVIGTPRYTSPESFRGEAASVQSDLYSLGVMLYELLAGIAPFPEEDYPALRVAVLAGGARPVRELAPDTPLALAAAVMRCLEHDPEGRPASAAELAHALEGIIVGAPSVPDGNPYRGLRAFDAAHRALFFGRGNDVGILVDRLRSESLVVVVGDSGIGKSSVCHAGVAPAITAGALGGDRTWRTVQITLGRSPWSALCDALGVDATAGARALRPAAGAGLLLVVDQLEELVTIADPAQAAQIAALLASIFNGVPGVKALLAVRGDFLTRVAALPELGGTMAHGLHLLRVLSRDDLHEAIIGPARTKNVRYESAAMIDELIDAVAQQPGVLPLLQFTLAELWNARDVDRAVIPEAALAALGGVEGALAGHADRVLLELGAAERARARRIVLRLVSEARTRAVRTREELGGDDAITITALESLVRGRLVAARDTVSGTPTYELAHEALIRSWSTLRDWLDAAAGEVAAHNRLLASAREWQRLGRRTDVLYSRRQLDEVEALDDIDPLERAFVAASRSQVRRRRIARFAAIVALPLLAVAIYGGVRFEAARQRGREVSAHVAVADTLRADADHLAREAAAARTRAFGRFDADATAEGERIWLEARALAAGADVAYRKAASELEGASLVDAGSVRAPMAKILWSHAALAEATNDKVRLGDLLDRLATYDRALRAKWDAPAHLVLDIDVPVMLTVHAASPNGTLPGGFDAPPKVSRATQHVDVELAPGSYLVIATATDRREVRMPLMLARGERLAEAITFPRAVPDGYVYVPAGHFLYGSDRDEQTRREYLATQPPHQIRTDAFLIARTEITFAEWIEFLRALAPTERAMRLPRVDGPQRAVRLEDTPTAFVLAIAPTDTWMRAAEGETFVYPGRGEPRAIHWERLPVVGVSATSIEAYAAWLDRTGRVPGARLCTVREWERAARGADGRAYAHGDHLTPAIANYDKTYGGNGYGPDEVGSFPASDSPFGLHDTVGNASEIVRWMPLGIKGGNFYQSANTALASNTTTTTPTLTTVMLGGRLCADPAR